MISKLFDVLIVGFKLWGSKESHKYLDETLKLKKDWLHEYSKPRGQRNNASLDSIELRLGLLSDTLVGACGKPEV